MSDIGSMRIILQGLGTAKEIARLFGFLESVEIKVDKLIQVELKAAINHLRDAEGSDTNEERITLLRDARRSFERAAHLEKGSNQAIALLGLSCCHAWLGDKKNSTRTLSRILDIDPVNPVHLVLSSIEDGNSKDGSTMTSLLFIALLVGVLLMMGIAIIATINGSTIDNKGAISLLWIAFVVIAFSLISRINIKKDYSHVANSSVERDPEGRAIKEIQLAISDYLQKPIPWMQKV